MPHFHLNDVINCSLLELDRRNVVPTNISANEFPTDIQIRLRGSNSSHEGRVEVYHRGQWGTICDDHWGFREATVVCRMLNYSAAVYAVRYAYFGEGNSTFPIWMDNVKCRGDEQTIAACRHRGWNNSDCSHYEDAGVVCYNSSIPPTEGKGWIISSTAKAQPTKNSFV